jgi:hypothetical protein
VKGNCEISVKTTINLKNYESMTVGVSFSEEYDADIEGNKEKKYYDLLEFSQLRLVELAEETKKTLIVIKE